jgi:nicotinamide-nucleotide amidase
VEQKALPEQVVRAAVERGVTIATAESLTAGMVSAALATVPGASATLQGAVVSYQNQVKTGLLGVDASLLERNGAVDAEVARQMAEGARLRMHADIAVATTGAAGPEPHGGKPVGTVYIGVATGTGSEAIPCSFGGDRASIREQACEAALTVLLRAIRRPDDSGGTN